MATVAASKLQKNFGEWHDKAFEEPVEITRYGRTTAVLLSASLYRDMLASYRKSLRAVELDDASMALISAATVETDAPYSLDDLPEIDEGDHAIER